MVESLLTTRSGPTFQHMRTAAEQPDPRGPGAGQRQPPSPRRRRFDRIDRELGGRSARFGLLHQLAIRNTYLNHDASPGWTQPAVFRRRRPVPRLHVHHRRHRRARRAHRHRTPDRRHHSRRPRGNPRKRTRRTSDLAPDIPRPIGSAHWVEGERRTGPRVARSGSILAL